MWDARGGIAGPSRLSLHLDSAGKRGRGERVDVRCGPVIVVGSSLKNKRLSCNIGDYSVFYCLLKVGAFITPPLVPAGVFYIFETLVSSFIGPRATAASFLSFSLFVFSSCRLHVE